ncbi:MAG: YtxH domain-containing protein [Bacteroidota bacterium]
MSITSKNLGIFILGVGAGLAAAKYISLTPEEKEELLGNIKSKTKEYFDDISSKGGETVKQYFGDAGKIVSDLFAKKENSASNAV